MTLGRVYIGSVGPFEFESDPLNPEFPGEGDRAVYVAADEVTADFPLDLTTLRGIRAETVRITDAPIDVDAAVRLGDLDSVLSPAPRMLATITGVDLTATGSTDVYSGGAQTTYLFWMLVHVTAATGVTSVPDIGIVQNPGNTLVVPRTPATGMDAIGETRTIFVGGTSFSFGGGAVGSRAIDLANGAAAGAYEATVWLFGWEDPLVP